MKYVFLALSLFSLVAPAVQVVTEGTQDCREYQLNQDLPVYKDPALFLPSYGGAGRLGDTLVTESPLITTVRGKVRLMHLGPEREFKGFGALTRLYELQDPRFRLRPSDGSRRSVERAPLIVPVMFCSPSDPYRDTLGFVLLSDLVNAQKPPKGVASGLPPSTYPNPIPAWRKSQGG